MPEPAQASNAGGDAAAQAAAAAASGGGAASNEPWYPPEHKDYVANKGWKTPADVLTSTINLEKLIGADQAGRTIVLPKDANDVEGNKAFRAKLGVPDAPEAYELPVPEGTGGDFAKTASAWFHEAGIPKAAAQKITENWNKHFGEVVKQQQAAEQAQLTQQMDALKGSWGEQFNANTELAKRSAKQFATVAKLDEANVASILDAVEKSASIRQLFAAIGKSVGEHGFAAGDAGGGGFGAQKGAVKKQIDELMDRRVKGQVGEKEYLSEIERLNVLLENAA